MPENSAVLSVFITVLSMLICSFCGLRLCDLPEQKKEFFFSLILLSMMIPTSSLVIPMFKMFNSMHLLNTKLGVVLPALSTAFLIFFFRQNTKTFRWRLSSRPGLTVWENSGSFKIYMPMMKSTMRQRPLSPLCQAGTTICGH